MQNTDTPPVTSFLPATLFLVSIGWGGLAILLWYTQPELGPRWLFFFLSVLALTGTALPVVAFLNRRFPTKPAATPEVIVREALWFGIYFPTLAWLRIPRVLTISLAVLLLLGLVLIEWLLRLRERSQWKP
ncbi:MAG: hypothetical protein EHM70_12865 [Chloroflexota bacterium]|nr:MAG: hypothetical protein EHM70_12865 [Chloroflexota bacterium]